MEELRASYKKSSFGPAFFFLGKERKQALACYYAFCRLMDDIADEPHYKDKPKELDFWQAEIENVYAGEAQTALGRDLQIYVRKFSIPKDRFLLIIEGMRADAAGQTYPTLQALEWYLYRVASAVGLACMDIVGVKSKKAEPVAREMGYGVQLTNIIRDVWEDAAMGRVYLPDDLLAKHGLTRQDVLAGKPSAQTAAALAELAGHAKKFYAAAYARLTGSLWRKTLPCRLMGYVYYANLLKIEKTGFLFTSKIKLTRFEKIKTITYALFAKIS